jgi:hypothetical protein
MVASIAETTCCKTTPAPAGSGVVAMTTPDFWLAPGLSAVATALLSRFYEFGLPSAEFTYNITSTYTSYIHNSSRTGTGAALEPVCTGTSSVALSFFLSLSVRIPHCLPESGPDAP